MGSGWRAACWSPGRGSRKGQLEGSGPEARGCSEKPWGSGCTHGRPAKSWWPCPPHSSVQYQTTRSFCLGRPVLLPRPSLGTKNPPGGPANPKHMVGTPGFPGAPPPAHSTSGQRPPGPVLGTDQDLLQSSPRALSP